jgi:ligand-binding SRPBCC domain-containing protein
MTEKPANAHIFIKKSVMKTTLRKMMQFHEHPKAFSKLTPPPIFVQVHRDDRTSITNGEIEFTLWFGFIPLRWIACHQQGPVESSFVDELLKGPMAYWRHEHIFTEVDGGVELMDRITIAHKSGVQGILTRLLFDGIPLKFLFFYRHLRTRLGTR